MKKIFGLKTSKGFSLVELMVTVAVIGILAAIGIPNYKKHRMKAYQAEAKSSLSALYVAERSFQLEYNGFHSSLQAVGFMPLGRLRYNVGFGSAGTIPASYVASHAASTRTTKTSCTGPFGTGTDTRCQIIVDAPPIPAGATVSATNYEAAALSYEVDLLARHNKDTTPLMMIANKILLGIEEASASCGGCAHDPNVAATLSVDSWVIDQNKQLQYKQVSAKLPGGMCQADSDCPAGTTCDNGMCYDVNPNP